MECLSRLCSIPALQKMGCGVQVHNPRTLEEEVEGRNSGVIFGYLESWRPAWDTGDPSQGEGNCFLCLNIFFVQNLHYFSHKKKVFYF